MIERPITYINKFEKMMKLILINVIIFLFIVSPNSFSQDFKQVAKIVSSDRNVDDDFGNSVSIFGDYAVVGAMYEDDDENGDEKYLTAGSAYVFKKDDDNNWTQLQKIVASDRESLDRFGDAVAISDNFLVVGASFQCWDDEGVDSISNAGAVYVFEKESDGTWGQMQKIVANDRSASSYFGFSVAISNSFIIVGAYTNSTDENDENSKLFAGAAYIFAYQSETSSWIQLQKIVSSDRNKRDYFGYAVAISDSFAIVSANAEDEDENGDNMLSSAGSAYIFKYDKSDTQWSQTQKIVASDRAAGDCFGQSLSLDGENAIIGAYKEGEDVSGDNTLQYAGSAYIFKYNESDDTWSQIQKLVASDRSEGDNFGCSVGLSGELAVVGANNEDDSENTVTSAGAGYCFKQKSDGTWEQINKIVANSRYESDEFGCSVAINDSTIIAAAAYNDFDESEDNEILNSGSAYIYEYSDNSSTDVKVVGGANEFLVYPNPASDILYVNQSNISNSTICAYFYDVTGQLKKTYQLKNGNNAVPVTGLFRGLYFVKVGSKVFKINLK